MTYVIANTQYLGKKWAKTHLFHQEKYKVWSTRNQIVGHLLSHNDCVYILTTNKELLQTLIPACLGCSIYTQGLHGNTLTLEASKDGGKGETRLLRKVFAAEKSKKTKPAIARGK